MTLAFSFSKDRKMSKAIVFGSLNMDLSILCDRIPQEGETMNGSDFLTNPGGKGANQAVAASRLGADVSMIGAVGEDEFGNVLTDCMEDAGIGCLHLRHLDGTSTGIAVIIRCNNNNRIILDHGANYSLDPNEVCTSIDEIAEPGDIFLTQFECNPETTHKALEHAHDKGLFCIVNPAPAKPLTEDLYKNIDSVCINETECEIITGIYPHDEKEAAKAADILEKNGIPQVIITLGSSGAYGRDKGKDYFVPAFKTNAVDTTAAGDTFIGAMIAAMADGLNFEDAMRFSNMASAITVSREGAQQSIPNRVELEEYRKEKGL